MLRLDAFRQIRIKMPKWHANASLFSRCDRHMILGKRLFIAMLIAHLCKIIFPSRSPLVRCEKEGLLCIPNHDRQNVRTNSEKRNEKRSDKGEDMITIECSWKIKLLMPRMRSWMRTVTRPAASSTSWTQTSGRCQSTGNTWIKGRQNYKPDNLFAKQS